MADEIKQDALNPADASGQEKLSEHDPEFKRQMNLAEKIMRDDDVTLRKLAGVLDSAQSNSRTR